MVVEGVVSQCSVGAQVRLEAGDEMVRWDAVLWPHTSTSPPTSAVTPGNTLQTHIYHISQAERDTTIIICSVRGPATVRNTYIVRFYNYLPETLASSRW